MKIRFNRVKKKDPPGMHVEALNTFSLLVRNLSQSDALLAETSFERSLSKLLGIPLPPQPVQSTKWLMEALSLSDMNVPGTVVDNASAILPVDYGRATIPPLQRNESMTSITSTEAMEEFQYRSESEAVDTVRSNPPPPLGLLRRAPINSEATVLDVESWVSALEESVALLMAQEDDEEDAAISEGNATSQSAVPGNVTADQPLPTPNMSSPPMTQVSFKKVARASGILSNSVLRTLARSPRLTRMFLEVPSPTSSPLPSGFPSSHDESSVRAHPPSATAREAKRKGSRVPRRFRPLETAMEIMSCKGKLGRIGRETVEVACVKLVTAMEKEWRRESELLPNTRRALTDTELAVLYGDYVSYLIHHSQLPALLAQELAIRFSAIPGTKRASSSRSSSHIDVWTSVSSLNIPLAPSIASFLRFWSFVDRLIQPKSAADGTSADKEGHENGKMVREALCSMVVDGFLLPLVIKEVKWSGSRTSKIAISFLATLLSISSQSNATSKTTTTLQTAILDSIAETEGCLEAIIECLKEGWHGKEPKFTETLLNLLDSLLLSNHIPILNRLLGHWSPYINVFAPSPVHQSISSNSTAPNHRPKLLGISGSTVSLETEEETETKRGWARDAYVSLLFSLPPASPEDLDSYIHTTISRIDSLPKPIQGHAKTFPEESNGLLIPVLPEWLNHLVVIANDNKTDEMIATRMALLIESLSIVGCLEGVLGLAEGLVELLQDCKPPHPKHDSTKTLNESQPPSSRASTVRPENIIVPAPSPAVLPIANTTAPTLNRMLSSINPLQWLMGSEEDQQSTPAQSSAELTQETKPSSGTGFSSWFSGTSQRTLSSSTLLDQAPSLSDLSSMKISQTKTDVEVRHGYSAETKRNTVILQAAAKAVAASLVVRFGRGSLASQVTVDSEEYQFDEENELY
ncbi:hypothetical protein HDU97_000543 [Phlyctochytrium planicorne]|nr:hypothetical protein HDU97_000543 [Phlyctochytrium planicorne]